MSRPALKTTQPLTRLVPRFFSGDKEDCILKLIIHIGRVPMLKMGGVLTPLCAFMSWIGIRLPLDFIPVVIGWVFLCAQ
jgi:hypothetical protein